MVIIHMKLHLLNYYYSSFPPILPQDTSNRNKHSDIGDSMNDQNAYYIKKIQELVNEKVKRFAHEDAIATTFKECITNEINGNDIELVIKKKLYANDLLRSQNRFSMPINQLETHEFLTETERQDLEDGKEFELGLLGPRLKMHEKPMVMKLWRLKSTNGYMLKSNWNEFVKENDEVLKENSMIHVWSFRRDGRLCFALGCIDDVA